MQGLNTDFTPMTQPDNTYRYALNMVETTDVGEEYLLSNEESNQYCVDFEADVVGSIQLNNDEFVIFTLNSLWLFNSTNCTKQLIVECPNLNNQAEIVGVFKVLEDCNQREIYWTDGVNPNRMLNIDTALLGQNEYANTCDFNLFKCSTASSLNITVLDSGGYIRSGSVQFAYRYDGGNVQYITNAVPIYDDVISTNADGIIGDTPTNKSVKIQLGNADLNKKFVELIVIKTINGVQSAEIIAKLDVVTGLIYTYDGKPGIAISMNEILVNQAFYQKSSLITEFQNQLLLGGLRTIRNIDYQQFANNIKVEWFSTKISTDTLYKFPKMYDYKTFMGDEVYALGVVPEFCDGSIGPVFHIPGRQKLPGYDDIIIPKENPDNFLGCDAERWEVYNTAFVTETPHEEGRTVEHCGEILGYFPGVWERGELGYNEQCIDYPEINNCENERMYLDGKVRHHRIPDRSLVPHFDSNPYPRTECLMPTNDHVSPNAPTYIYPIGLEFSNIELPATEIPILNLHFVYVKRTDSNKSVIAKCITHKCFNTRLNTGIIAYHPHYNVNGVLTVGTLGSGIDQGTTSAYSDPTTVLQGSEGEDNTVYKLHSPNLEFQKPYLSPSYFTVEQTWHGRGNYYGVKFKNSLDEDTYSFNFNFNVSYYNQAYDLVRPTAQNKNRRVLNSTYLKAHSTSNAFDKPLINLHQESGAAIQLDREDARLQFASVVDPLTAFTAYCPDTLFEQDRDTSLTPLGSQCYSLRCAKALYGGLKRYQCNQYGQLEQLIYNSLKIVRIENITPTNKIKVFGDAFINYWSYRRTALLSANQNIDGNVPDFDTPLPLNTLIHGYFESDINVDLRHEGAIGTGEVYYPRLGNNQFSLSPNAIFNGVSDYSYLGYFHYNGETKNYINLGVNNYTEQNNDYNIVNPVKSYFGITRNYKTCECNTEFLSSIALSDTNDWDVFRPNNFLRIPYTYGKLTNLFTMSNNLYAHTEDNLWRIFTSDSKLSVDSGEIFIGNGVLVNSIPKYLYAAKEGVAGLQRRGEFLLNQYGYYFFDQKIGELYKFTENLEPMGEGNVAFFKNTKDHIRAVYGFDHKYKRLLMTAHRESDCKSFTFSFSEKSKKWKSFHSYKPNYYLQTRANFYSVAGNAIWKHNIEDSYQTYYSTYYPAEIELIDKHEGVKIWNNFSYLQNAWVKDATYNVLKPVNETFTNVTLYNRTQNSGKMTLKHHTDSTINYMENAVVDTLNTIKVNRKEEKWHLDELNDFVVDYTIPHHYYPCIFPIDYTLTPSIDLTKPYYEIQRFRDLYLACRLSFDDATKSNVKINLILTNNNLTNSIR